MGSLMRASGLGRELGRPVAMIPDPPFELFHAIADPASARVRRFVSEAGLHTAVKLRNVHYPEVQADFAARGGKTLPAVWDGERLYEGAEASIGRLRAHLGARR